MMTAIYPVCKMKVDVESARLRPVFQGKEYYFCAPGWKKAFDKDPAKFL